MSAKKTTPKRNSSPLFPAVKKLVQWIRGRGRPIVLAATIATMFFIVWYAVWQGVGERVLSSDHYWLTIDQVEITRPPEWIHADIRAEVFRDASLDRPLSIVDQELAKRVFDAFSLHPWIAEVRRVTKHHPARVKVDLVYRRPVCMVASSGRLLPVDIEGVLLPADDFSPVAAERYPRLEGVNTLPVGPAGTRWGDVRVVGAAEIAAAFGSAWKELSLDRIVVSATAETGPREEVLYELFTKGGTRILWGRAPGTDMPGEVPAADKVARLKKYKAANGTLEGPNGPQQLDVRSLRSMRVAGPLGR